MADVMALPATGDDLSELFVARFEEDEEETGWEAGEEGEWEEDEDWDEDEDDEDWDDEDDWDDEEEEGWEEGEEEDS